MGRTERIDGPRTAIFPVGNQSPDADNRVVDMLGEPVADGGTNFVIGLAGETVGSREAF